MSHWGWGQLPHLCTPTGALTGAWKPGSLAINLDTADARCNVWNRFGSISERTSHPWDGLTTSTTNRTISAKRMSQTKPSIDSFVLLLILSFVHLLIHPLMYSSTRSFIQSFISNSFIYSFIHSFVCPTYPFLRSYIHPFIRGLEWYHTLDEYFNRWIYLQLIQWSRLIHELPKNHPSLVQCVPMSLLGIPRFYNFFRRAFRAGYSFPVQCWRCPQRNYSTCLIIIPSIETMWQRVCESFGVIQQSMNNRFALSTVLQRNGINLLWRHYLFVTVNYPFMFNPSSTCESRFYPSPTPVRQRNCTRVWWGTGRNVRERFYGFWNG